MKTFKKISMRMILIGLIAICGFSGFIGGLNWDSTLINTAFAQNSFRLTAPEVLPGDLDAVYEINTVNKNPLIPTINQGVEAILLNSQGTGEQSAVLAETFKKIINNNKFTFGIKMEPLSSNNISPDAYITFQINNEDFSTLVNNTPGLKKEAFSNTIIYNKDDVSYFALLGDLLVASPRKENLTKTIENYTKKTGSTLSKNENYMGVQKYNLSNSFLNIYTNPSFIWKQNTNSNPFDDQILEILKSSDFNSDLFKTIVAQTGSIAQTDKGFAFSTGVKGDKAKIMELNLDFNKYNFVPELYRMLSGKDLILYHEGNNIKDWIGDSTKMMKNDSTILKTLNTWKSNFKESSGIDFDADLMPLLTGKHLITLHKTNQILPAATLIFDMQKDTNKAKEILSKLTTYLQNELEKLEKTTGKKVFTTKTSIINSVSFYEFNIDLGALGKESEINALPEEKRNIRVVLGLTNEGKLVISNHVQFEDIFLTSPEGLTNNPGFGQAFNNRSETVTSNFYLSFGALNDYLQTFIDAISTFAATEKAYAKKVLGQSLQPWNDLSVKSYATIDTSWASGTLQVDIQSMISSYQNLFQEFFKMNNGRSETSDLIPYIKPVTIIKHEETKTEEIDPTTGFCDVHEEDWFAGHITGLRDKGIINGYQDGCFRPGNSITRAEFITLAMKAKQLTVTDSEWDYSTNQQFFNDVPKSNGTWFSDYANSAAAKYNLKGFPDKTFRPNNKITRAEAIQIIYNLSKSLQTPPVEAISSPCLDTQGYPCLAPFQDVKKSDWYYYPTFSAYSHQIINGPEGSNTNVKFNPNQNLNRAEAAKMIEKLLNIEN